jgi:serine/threonine protein kinase
MYLIMARTMPFPKPRAMATYCSGQSQFPSGPPTAKGISKESVGFVEDLLNPQPFKRPSASSASQHEWVQLSHPIQTNSGALADPEIKVHHSPPFRPRSPILLPAEEASTETPANTQDGSPIEHPRTPNISVDGRLNNEARHKSRRTEKSPIAMFSRGYTDSVSRSSSDGTPMMPSPVHTDYGKFSSPKNFKSISKSTMTEQSTDIAQEQRLKLFPEQQIQTDASVRAFHVSPFRHGT